MLDSLCSGLLCALRYMRLSLERLITPIRFLLSACILNDEGLHMCRSLLHKYSMCCSAPRVQAPINRLRWRLMGTHAQPHLYSGA
jgi:hypothetical protein